MRSIKNIVGKNLCIGCGLCEAVCGKEAAIMQEQSSGFLAPVLKNLNIEHEELILRICPGINVLNDQPFGKLEKVWGKVLENYSGYSTDKEVRTKGSSGGVISAVAIYMLEKGMVDAVLQVGGDSSDYRRNGLRVSKTREDVLACAASRYAPSAVFNEIVDILNCSEESYLFIGKPCDISGIKNFLNEFPQYKRRFKLFMSIICAGIPSFIATQDVIETFENVKYPISKLKYRGEGWPGFFSFVDFAGTEHKMSYNESWGKKLGKRIHFRCKICPDGIGLQADLTVGDAWETADGYPDFTERDGQSLIMLRTAESIKIIGQMQKEGCLNMEILSLIKMQSVQPFQHSRRQVVGVRVAAAIIGKGIMVRFRGMRIWSNLLNMPLLSLLREFFGTLKRSL